MAELPRGEETYVSADAGYTGVHKCEAHKNCGLIGSIAMRPSLAMKRAKTDLIGQIYRRIEYAKMHMRAKVEHPFRVIKQPFGHSKVRYRGLVKNTAQLLTLFALSTLWMVRRTLLKTEEVRP